MLGTIRRKNLTGVRMVLKGDSIMRGSDIFSKKEASRIRFLLIEKETADRPNKKNKTTFKRYGILHN